MSVKQKTIKTEFSLKGKGLHTGKPVCVTFKAAEPDTGYVFVRKDMENNPVVPALALFVRFVDRSSCLEKDGVRIYTMEHALAALYGCGIDNCIIELDAEEMPILDGSARIYVEEILKSGIVEQDKDRNFFVVKEKIEVKNGESETSICILPDDGYDIDVIVDYGSPYLSMQYASYREGQTDFVKEVCNARTFVFLREVEPLLDSGLIKGGDLENAIVIVDEEISEEKIRELKMKFDYKDLEVHTGILNNNELLFSNEPARHKLLDVIGDLALCGRFIKGRVIANRPGHKANTALAQKMCKTIVAMERENACPDINPADKPLLDINNIRNLLPHRPPFLLVDKVMSMTHDMIIGCKNVTMNEPFFVGHFPEEPVMPGVLIIEAMCQCGGVLVLNGVEDPENYSTYFMKIDNVKFRNKVVPGDTLIFKLVLTAPIRRGVVEMKGYTFVGETLVCEGEFTAMVARTKK